MLCESSLFLVFLTCTLFQTCKICICLEFCSLTNINATQSRLRRVLLFPINFSGSFCSHLLPSSTDKVFSILIVMIFQEIEAFFESVIFCSAQCVWYLYMLVHGNSVKAKFIKRWINAKYVYSPPGYIWDLKCPVLNLKCLCVGGLFPENVV